MDGSPPLVFAGAIKVVEPRSCTKSHEFQGRERELALGIVNI